MNYKLQYSFMIAIHMPYTYTVFGASTWYLLHLIVV